MGDALSLMFPHWSLVRSDTYVSTFGEEEKEEDEEEEEEEEEGEMEEEEEYHDDDGDEQSAEERGRGMIMKRCKVNRRSGRMRRNVVRRKPARQPSVTNRRCCCSVRVHVRVGTVAVSIAQPERYV